MYRSSCLSYTSSCNLLGSGYHSLAPLDTHIHCRDKYEEASEQAKRAVASDRRLRIYYSSPSQDPDQGGLIFLARLGSVDLDHPV
jgi:hypothetical protein